MQMILQVVPMRESETSEGFIYAGSSAALAGKLRYSVSDICILSVLQLGEQSQRSYL